MFKKTYSTTELFARFLAKQITYHVAEREGMIESIKRGEETETPKVWQELEAEYDEIIEQQKKQGKYSHDSGCLVLMDYKNLRSIFAPEGSGIMTQIASNFSSSMTKEDFLNTARGVVEQWQALSGREMKK